MGAEALAKRSSRYANHHVRHVKSLGQNVRGYQAVDLCVRSAKVFDGNALEVIVLLVGDRDKVISGIVKLFLKVAAMFYASTEHNGLAWAAKDLVGFLNPFAHDVAGDLHTALAYLIGRPFARCLLGALHVDLFRHKDLEWG